MQPELEDFANEVKNRECYVKTFDVEGPKWVGCYWRDMLVPVQRAITVAALAVVLVLPMEYFNVVTNKLGRDRRVMRDAGQRNEVEFMVISSHNNQSVGTQ